MKMIVITGWGLGTHVLTPFTALLKAAGHEVELWDIFDPFDSDILLEKLNQAEKSELLIGWSLGGQLALYLAYTLQTRRQIMLPVICCMSNPCFVAQQEWPHAMPQRQYQNFATLIDSNTLKGIHRFCHLVSMGSSAPLKRAKTLQSYLSKIDLNYQKDHLYLLEQLDLRKILYRLSSNMLFLIGNKDQLVPCKVSNILGTFEDDRLNIEILEASHDSILFEPELIIASILHFLENALLTLK